MGFLDRFLGGARREGRRAKAARVKELAGDLPAAVDLYQEAGLPDEAARVLLLRADVERSAEKRIALFSLAAYTAASEEIKQRARGRKAKVAFDVLRGRGGSFMKSEVLSVARELEEAGELEHAADAYALAGDAESEVRVLAAAGAIERLEERLRETEASAREQRELELALRRIMDLDRTAERRAALELALATLAKREDDRIADVARAIRARLTRGPVVELEIGGEVHCYALGAEVTIGRGDSTILIASRAVSRRHLRIFRGEGDVFVEDLDTRNGTSLAGARLTAPIPVGQGIQLELGGEVPCEIHKLFSKGMAPGDLFKVTVADVSYAVPLGELKVSDLRIDHEAVRDESFVVLRTPDGAARPYLSDLQLAARVELCAGDEIRQERGGPVLIRVPSSHMSSLSQEETMVQPRRPKR